MSNLKDEKTGKRTIRNSATNNAIENYQNYQNTEESITLRVNPDNKKDIQENVINTPETQRNLNEQVNTETNPISYARDNILDNKNVTSVPVQQQLVQNQNINNVNLNANNENRINVIQSTQPVPIVSTPNIIVGQQNPTNGIILNHQFTVMPSVNYVRTYKPFEMTCPFCFANVITVPETSWSCGACCLTVLLGYLSVGLYPCIRCCVQDFCCFDAKHRCPNCRRIIAEHRSIGPSVRNY